MTNPPTPTGPVDAEDYGPNAWLVEETYEQYQSDPSSVSPTWQEFFADYRPPGRTSTAPTPPPRTAPEPAGSAPSQASAPAPVQTSPTASPVAPAAAPPAAQPAASSTSGEVVLPGDPIRGVGARIVTNMTASLDVPTATSFREVPAKLLEVNRRIINGYLGRTRGGKVSFTHLIGYAVVRAIADHVRVMNNTFVEGPDGSPRIVRNDHVGLGLAVDIEKKDGSHSLVVPCIRDADALDFRGFWQAYEDIIKKVRANKLTPDDFAGTTVSLTNPGTIGTERSVPRLMPGQGSIIGVGTLDYPTGFAGADPHTIAELGVSK
ncbi:MAG TPA: 2-oxo acid dehydrogenase subunit E2, partial [Acidimicrobiales bacterium]